MVIVNDKIGDEMNTLVICLIIFFARIMDVTLGSLRIIFLGKEKSFFAFCFGFLEIFIWFMVAKDALTKGDNWWVVLAYCSGYAVGTYIGSLISQHFIKGTLGVQIVTSSRDDEMIHSLRKNGYAVSAIDIRGRDKNSNKYMLFLEINKKRFDSLRYLVKELDPTAFVVVNDTKYVQNGYFK